MPRQIAIRRVLIIYLSTAVVVLGGAIAGVMHFGQRRLAERSCDDAIQVQLRLAEQRLRAFFDPVVRDVELLREMGRRGSLDVDRPAGFEPLFQTLLRENPQASAVMLADDRGREFFIAREGDQWTSRQTRRDQWNDRQQVANWRLGEAPVTSETSSDYDPRRRPWFRQAIRQARRDAPGNAPEGAPDNARDNAAPDNAAPEGDARDAPEMASESVANDASPDPAAATAAVYWTRPYWFFNRVDPGLTASAWFLDAHGRNCVVAVDVLLRDLRDFTQSLRVGRKGSLTFLDSHGWPIDSPESLASGNGELESLKPTTENFSRPEVYTGVAALEAAGSSEPAALRFAFRGRAWWADTEQFHLSKGRDWRAVVVVPESDFTDGWRAIRLWLGGATISVLAIGILLAVRLADRICRPLEALVRNSEQMAKGDLSQPIAVASNVKEVSDLEAAQERMRAALQSVSKFERDLRVAREIQQSTFPDSFPEVHPFQVAGWSEPAEQTGGDTFDVVEVESDGSAERTIYLLLADASGHGVGPALSAVRIHSLFRVAVEERKGVVEIASMLNRHLCRLLPDGRFATAWVGRLNPADQTLESFSAGQGPILWLHASRDEVDIDFNSDGFPCGIMEYEVSAPAATRRLQRGDILAVISDGVFEAANEAGEQYGAPQVAELLRQSRELSAGEIVTAIRQGVDEHSGGVAASDDRTILIVKCGPS